ncbi:spindle assembly checkpoint component Mad1 [Pisolithus croceorrhizus]|nr:spindle assembly checkpoint component Mad1 [Pisolithus croceorrhizus]KAI6122548.1 spindle assembly checkpoint component Mad1 [Pisolithus croceorrhizus]KAI6126984.1 spindle assembly checkpoint component Mad1 [Pisolithus sp. B1]
MAELERDPQHSTAKRQQRSQAFSSTMAHASLERQLLAAQTGKAEAEAKLRDRESCIKRLEQDRRFLAEREQAEREEKKRERTSSAEERRKAEADLRDLRESLATLRDKYIETEEEYSALKRSYAQLSASQSSQTTSLARRNNELEQELAEYKALVEDKEATVQTLQQKLDDLEGANAPPSNRHDDDQGWVVIRDELHRQAAHMRSLETTNAKLNAELGRYKDRHANIEILREEKHILERKVTVTEELRERVVLLEAQVEAARRERQEWANKSTEPGMQSDSSLSLVQSLSELRLTHARLFEEHGATVAALSSREAELTRTQEMLSEAQSTVSTLQAEVSALNAKVTRREQRAQLAERETGFLRALVASYVAEGVRDAAEQDNPLLQRIQQLEQSLSDYKTLNSTLQEALDGVDAEAAVDGIRRSPKELTRELEQHKSAAVEASKALEEARTTINAYEHKVEDLEQTLWELRGQIGAGNHVPPGMRVLCLRDNPAQQWNDLRQSVLDRLKNENEALIKRLRDLENNATVVESVVSTSKGDDLIPKESWDVLDSEKKELEETVKQKEKRLLRLQQVFSAKSAEFREAITSILGFKLAFYPNGQVRLTSIYDLSASFVFQPQNQGHADGARMQLVAQGEGGPQDLPELMNYWVGEEQCIPGFLASVTLDCYDRTRGGGELNAT